MESVINTFIIISIACIFFFSCELARQILVLHSQQPNRRRRNKPTTKTWQRVYLCDLPEGSGSRRHRTPARLHRIPIQQTPVHSQEDPECPHAPRKETRNSSTSSSVLSQGGFESSGLDIFRAWRNQPNSPRSEDGPTPTQGSRRSRGLEPYVME